MNTVFFKNLGTIDFKEAWGLQEKLLSSILLDKKEKRPTKNYLLFCQHPHVYTLGKSGEDKNMLLNNNELKSKNASFYKINRGGDITYHGPGQLVVYPILDLDNFFTDIHKYLRYLEEIIILILEKYNIVGFRIDGSTGVWVRDSKDKFKKICAMGVRASRWITMHGLALNISVDLNYFKNIVPCGISDKGVTSLNILTNDIVSFCEVENLFKRCFEKVFSCKLLDLKK